MLWENLKRKAKAASAMQADNNYGTGGGKARKVVADPIVDMVVGLIRPHVEPFHNIYDDNYEEGMSNITTDTNEFEEIIVKDVLCPEDINNDLEDEDISLQNNWSQYNPAMMKTQISAALRQPPKASLPIPSTSKMSTNITNANMSKDIQPITVLTPPKNVDGKKGVSRRRPTLNTTLASETFLEAKKLSLDAMSRDAGEEHKVQMKILKLKLLQEGEKLKQEKMKTEILKLQIQRETGTEWVFDRNNETDNID
ncbi:uncharacterized protein LOC132933063 [Metopolophium dirhodum]|nr:uncharacterized protein LOC132933063 [Metopolophium dirhodum]